jgi:hypothetical protein
MALAALAGIATREADQREGTERADLRRRELARALDRAPELPRPKRPTSPPLEGFNSGGFVGATLIMLFISFIWIGYWISGVTMFQAGFPWLGMLILSAAAGLFAGFWPILRTMPAREGFQAEMRNYQAAIAAADRRDIERRDIRERFEGTK